MLQSAYVLAEYLKLVERAASNKRRVGYLDVLSQLNCYYCILRFHS